MTAVPRTATQDASLIRADVLPLCICRRLRVVAEAPFPHVSAHILHAIRRRAIREDAHRARLAYAGFVSVALGRVESILVGINAPVLAARRIHVMYPAKPPREPPAESPTGEIGRSSRTRWRRLRC